eukprot:TRINITY_DN5926_c0_g1_i2.p1 TRINITY_DN5926_c0_g1~~TRINITY_DN5926_c0_g1_i2.p1  ORF type:complete len:217 (+),score=53.85 TRINITY_DN5926_c0_g1_i2:254-904(+)
MMAFQGIGTSLERSWGTLRLFSNIWLFAIGSGIIHCVLASIADLVFNLHDFYRECTIGFSGVLFGMMVVTTYLMENQSRSIFGLFTIPNRAFPWVLLVVLQFILPSVSFLGHLSGMIMGYIYGQGWLERVQPSSTRLSQWENKVGWIVTKDGYITNPELGIRNPTSIPMGTSILPVRAPVAPTRSAFPGTGFTLGSAPEPAPSTVPLIPTDPRSQT